MAPVFAEMIDEAVEAGASPEQIALLRDAGLHGELTFEHLRSAIDATYACLEDNGVVHGEEQVVTSAAGITTISYNMRQVPGLTLDESAAVADECALKNSDFVQELNGTQPKAVALLDAFKREVVVPGLVACFDAYEVDYDPKAKPDELWDLSFGVVVAEPSAKPGDLSAAGCLLDAWQSTGGF